MNFLLVGLGNPGLEYKDTRHNVGFIALDQLAHTYKASFKLHKKFNAEISDISCSGNKVLLAKPLTYMNLSGSSVASIMHYYKIDINNIFVIHDDIDLALGRIKIKQGGSSAGHNGLKSIDAHITPNYKRIRVGIGKPEHQDVSSYVLSKFSKSEYEEIEIAVNKIIDNLTLTLNTNNFS